MEPLLGSSSKYGAGEIRRESNVSSSHHFIDVKPPHRSLNEMGVVFKTQDLFGRLLEYVELRDCVALMLSCKAFYSCFTARVWSRLDQIHHPNASSKNKEVSDPRKTFIANYIDKNSIKLLSYPGYGLKKVK